MSKLSNIWKKIGGKNWVNRMVGKMIRLLHPIILKHANKYLDPVVALKLTDEIIAEANEKKEQIW